MTQFTFAALLVSSLLNSLAPGPCMLLVVARATVAGLNAGFAVIAGVLTAITAYMILAWLMLAFAVRLPDAGYLGIRAVGVGLLVYLSWQMVAASTERPAGHSPTGANFGRDYLGGLLVGFSSPFNLIYMFGILPQIIPPTGVQLHEGALIFLTVLLGTALPKSIATIAAARLGHVRDVDRARVTGRWVNRMSALVMITFAGLGAIQIMSDDVVWSRLLALN